MQTPKEIEILIEREDVYIIRRRDPGLWKWCEACGSQVRMVMPEVAAAIIGASWREIARRIEIGQLHFIELPGGYLLVCVNSLK